MQRIDTATRVTNLFGAGMDGFTGGDPTTTPPTPPTNGDAAWHNAVQEELAQTIEGLGAALNGAVKNQLFQALIALACQEANWHAATSGSLLGGGDFWVDVAYGNGVRIAVSNTGVVARASDYTNGVFATVTIPSASQMTAVATDGNGKWIIGGTGGAWWVSADDGATWTLKGSPIASDVQVICYGGATNPTKFLVLCASNGVYSVDSAAWAVTTQPSFGHSSTGFVDAAATADGHIAVLYTTSGDQVPSFTTNLGATWNDTYVGWSAGNYSSIVYGDGALIALTTSGLISKSTDDGAHWTGVGASVVSGTSSALAVNPNRTGCYMLVGQTGLIAAARDGAIFNRRPHGCTVSNLNAVCYGNGLWTAVGGNFILESLRTMPADHS